MAKSLSVDTVVVNSVDAIMYLSPAESVALRSREVALVEDLGMDSLHLVELFTMVEEQTSALFPPDFISLLDPNHPAAIRTISSFVSYVETLIEDQAVPLRPRNALGSNDNLLGNDRNREGAQFGARGKGVLKAASPLDRARDSKCHTKLRAPAPTF